MSAIVVLVVVDLQRVRLRCWHVDAHCDPQRHVKAMRASLEMRGLNVALLMLWDDGLLI
jgi:hypothetical protein